MEIDFRLSTQERSFGRLHRKLESSPPSALKGLSSLQLAVIEQPQAESLFLKGGGGALHVYKGMGRHDCGHYYNAHTPLSALTQACQALAGK